MRRINERPSENWQKILIRTVYFGEISDAGHAAQTDAVKQPLGKPRSQETSPASQGQRKGPELFQEFAILHHLMHYGYTSLSYFFCNLWQS